MAWWVRGKAIDCEVKVAYVLSMAGEALGAFDICERAGLRPGTLYPLLAKFERMGMVTSVWEDEAAADRRRMYLWSAGPIKTEIGDS